MKIQDIQLLSGAPKESYSAAIAAEKRLDGAPIQTIDSFYNSPCQQFQCGFWQCDQGHWQVNYTEYEYCEIVAGMSEIIDTDGNSLTVTAGDRFVIPAGFSGSWKVTDFCKKVYVIFEPKLAASL
ncbi:DUF861 domain-containing protein [Shewanella sp. SNU WT4]|uniref:cupin domain-containing protein n=1 Tax=Shewanella sp. SNU WT4 TaxID=2590015 RepID=UPI00112D7192|nr:cupin domain-containing protein [Shewanella sp. SNU WT4]QDF67257.1 DUF861 domain-containing protein [Shewanella sp. SNU WT4]